MLASKIRKPSILIGVVMAVLLLFSAFFGPVHIGGAQSESQEEAPIQ